MNDKNYNHIPKPDIRFEGKNELKKRGHFATFAWIGSSVAAALVIGVAVLWPGEIKNGGISETVAVFNSIADTVVAGTIEYLPESEAIKIEKNVSNLQPHKDIEKPKIKGVKEVVPPPQRRQNKQTKIETEVEKQIEPIRKREIRPTISIKPKVELAMVEIPKTDVNLELNETFVDQPTQRERAKNPNIEQLVQFFKSTNFVNSNLAKNPERDRSGNPNLKRLFEKPESSIKEVLFSKNEEN